MTIKTCLPLLLLATIPACAIQPTSNADEAASSSNEAVITTDYVWTVGAPPMPMKTTDDGFCFLTSVTGKFEGRGEWVRIWLNGHTFMLGGASMQSGYGVTLGATARCVSWSNFHGAVGGVVSGDTAPPPYGWASSSHAYGTHDTSAACYLSGITGQFNWGGGEYVGTWSDGAEYYKEAEALSGTGTAVASLCVQLKGVNGATFAPQVYTTPLLVVPDAQGPDGFARASEIVFDDRGGAPYGACMLTRAGGRLLGGGEKMAVSSFGASGWRMDLRAANYHSGVQGIATCFYF